MTVLKVAVLIKLVILINAGDGIFFFSLWELDNTGVPATLQKPSLGHRYISP